MQCGLSLQAIVLLTGKTLRVHAPNTWVLGIWVTVIIVQVWGKYMIIGYLDPEGKILTEHWRHSSLGGLIQASS